MKKTLITLSCFLTLCASLTAQEIKVNSVTKIIEEIKTKYAPDKRLAILNVAAVESSNIYILSGETNIPEAKQHLLKKLKDLHLNFTDEIHLLPEKNLGGKIYGLVNVSVANIRSGPDHPEELATQALLGTPVKIFKKASGFYLVQTPDNYISWVDDDGVTPINKTQLNEWTNSQKVIYTKEYGFSFSEPNEMSLRISDLTAGNILMYLSDENNFCKVKYPDGRIGFIEKNSCENFNSWLSKKNPTETDIINTSKLFMGIPYLWGGTSAKGMDCSGFTKIVYFLNGIVLARDASQQVNYGTLVDTQNGFDKLQPGDLLFFGTHKTDSTKERVTHVGIYLGNYEFIHEAGRVKINSFDRDAANFNEYRLKHFIRAKRILNSVDTEGITSIKKNKFYLGDI